MQQNNTPDIQHNEKQEIEHMRFALHAAGTGTWDIDPVSKKVRWDEQCNELFGFAANGDITYEETFKHVHPDDALSVEQAISKAIDPAIRSSYEARYRTIKPNGEVGWILSKGKAYFNEQGMPYRFAGTAQDITAEHEYRQQAKDAENLLDAAFNGASVGMAFTDLNGKYLSVNAAFANEVGYNKEYIVGRGYRDIMHPDDRAEAKRLFDELTAGKYPFFNMPGRYLHKNGTLRWVRINMTRITSDSAKEDCIMIMSRNISAEIANEHELAVSEAKFRALVEEAPIAMCLFDSNKKIELANEIIIGYWGKNKNIIGKTLEQAIPELKGQPFLQILDTVYETGKIFEQKGAQAHLVVNGTLGTYYFDYTFKPLLDAAGDVYGVLEMALDVTEQVISNKKLEESELFSRIVIQNSPVAEVVFTGEDMIIRTVNENMLALLGRDSSIIGTTLMAAMPELVDTTIMERLQSVLATGKTYYQPEEKIQFIKGGQPYDGYYNYTYKALQNTDGNMYGVMVTAIEVTDQVVARQKIEEAQNILNGAIELANLGTWSMDLETGILDYSERLRSWFGIGDDEKITVERAYQPIAEADRPALSASMTHALTPGTDGIYDIEYTVKASEAGIERILHAQGQAVYNESGMPHKISGTVQDVTAQRKIQLALQRDVQERTEELQTVNEELLATNEELYDSNNRLIKSNEELAQYAYVASHDLQEPLRKIMLFSGMLDIQENLREEKKILVGKITQSAERMSLLIRDLLDFSRLMKSETLMRPVNLSDVMNAVAIDFELTIAEKNATIHVGDLPVIEAVSLQMNQLLYNLLGNALKFTKADEPPLINVTSRAISLDEAGEYLKAIPGFNYHLITFADNGIGFEVKYSEQIFEVFKRLHGRDMYPGSGIGLALCRRIVTNHHGHMSAQSEPGKGCVFNIILPDKQFTTEVTEFDPINKI
jgi:PAS domain S-box-containing protein